MELRVPVEILHQILLHTHEVEEISSLNLVCKEFAALLQPRQFATVVLSHAGRAQALAAFCARKEKLLSQTIVLMIGNQRMDFQEAEELWAFLSTDTGCQLLKCMNVNTLRSISISSLSPELEESPTVLQPLALLGQGGHVSKMTMHNCLFSHVSKLCALVHLLRTVRVLDIESDMGFDYEPNTEDDRDEVLASKPGDGIADLESLIIRRINSWARVGTSVFDSLGEAGQLNSIHKLTAYCGSYSEALALAAYVGPVAKTLRDLIIRNPAPWYWPDEPLWEFLELPMMPCLENLRIIGFGDSFAEWFVGCVGPALLPSKTVIWSMALITSSKGGMDSEHIFNFQ
jgi:hypothetical protein